MWLASVNGLERYIYLDEVFSVIGHIYAVFTAVQAKTFLLFSVLQFRVCLPERSKVGCSGSSVVGGLVQAIAPFLFADFCSISLIASSKTICDIFNRPFLISASISRHKAGKFAIGYRS